MTARSRLPPPKRTKQAAGCACALLGLLVFLRRRSVPRPADAVPASEGRTLRRRGTTSSLAGLYSPQQASIDAETPYEPDPSDGGCCPLWRTADTARVEVLAGNSRMRMERHTVKVGGGEAVLEDWLWADERDSVVVLVQRTDGRYAVFRQTKYGLDGPSLAPVGGYIEDGETALEAARREVGEELRLTCARWLPLGLRVCIC